MIVLHSKNTKGRHKMSYTFRIGERIINPNLSKSEREEEGCFPWTAKQERTPEAPRLDWMYENYWAISYTGFLRIARATGMGAIMLTTKGWLRMEHPGYWPITPELIAKFEDVLLMNRGDDYDGKVIAWFVYWLTYALNKYGDDAVLLND